MRHSKLVLLIILMISFVACSKNKNEMPIAKFVMAPDSGRAPLLVNFDASTSNDPDGNIKAYTWDFGDGTTGDNQKIDHTYVNAGEYSVKLTVTDNKDASNTTTKIVTVDSNKAPIAKNKELNTVQDIAVDITLEATDAEGDTLTFMIIDAPQEGEITGTVPNLSYKPKDGFVGNDSFTFQVNDGRDDSNVATVNIIVLDDSEPNDSAEQAQTLALGTSINSFINPIADVDWYHFTLEQQTIVNIELRAKEIGSSLDSFISLYDENQNLIAQNNNHDASDTTDSFIKTTLQKGKYFITVQDASQVNINSINSAQHGLTTLAASKMFYEIINSQHPPVVDFVSIGNFLVNDNKTIYVTQQNVAVVVKASDNGAIIQVNLFLNGTQVASIIDPVGPNYVFEVDFPNLGENTLGIEAIDNDGNKSARISQKVTVDGQRPILNVDLLVNSNEVNISPPPFVNENDLVTIIATPSDESSDVDDIAIELKIAGVIINNTGTNNLGKQIYSLNQIVDFRSTNIIDVSLKAIDSAGNESDLTSFSLNVRDGEPNVPLPTASIDINNIEPAPINNSNCTLVACYKGTINIPVRVEDDTGTAKVTLVVDSKALGKMPIGTVSFFPYVFPLDTLNYPNNDKLTIIVQVVSEVGAGNDATPVTIEVFN